MDRSPMSGSVQWRYDMSVQQATNLYERLLARVQQVTDPTARDALEQAVRGHPPQGNELATQCTRCLDGYSGQEPYPCWSIQTIADAFGVAPTNVIQGEAAPRTPPHAPTG